MLYTVKKKLGVRTLYIHGMTCENCETRIENKVKKGKGVVQVDAEYRRSRVLVVYDSEITSARDIIVTIEKLGYEVLPSPKRSDIMGYRRKVEEDIDLGILMGIAVVVYLLYLITQNFGVDFLPQVNQTMGYGILFIVGILTSLHCLAMCGGINLSQCVTKRSSFNKGPRNLSAFKPSFLYNSGRVISYTFLGGVVGALGSVISLSGWAKGIVAVLAGIMMVIMGLNMLNVFPALRKFNPRMPKVLSKLSGENQQRGPFVVGLFNGLMPCGPLQAMQIYALGTGSMLEGATSMFFFSLGTVPLMFGLGALGSFLGGRFSMKMIRTSAVLVVVLGIIMLNRGLGLAGISFYSSGTGVAASIEGGVQTVTTGLDSGRYAPIIVQKDIPVKWTIEVDQGDLNGCNNPLTIPKYDYLKELHVGKNVIEFTPEREGKVVYSCWMGMIRSDITVVEDLSSDQI